MTPPPPDHNPGLRRLVLRGYANLAIIVLGTMALILPIVLDHGSVRGIQISLTLQALIVIGIALRNRFVTREWTTLFSGLVIFSALIGLIGVRFFDNTAVKDVTVLLILIIVYSVLPRVKRCSRTR
jgi:hypothetical protein